MRTRCGRQGPVQARYRVPRVIYYHVRISDEGLGEEFNRVLKFMAAQEKEGLTARRP